MAGTKINEATLRETLKGTENIPIVDTDLPKGRVTAEKLKEFVQPDLSGYAEKTGAEFTGAIGTTQMTITRPSQGAFAAILANSNDILFRTMNAGVDSITFNVQYSTPLKLTEAGIWENGQFLENKYAKLTDIPDVDDKADKVTVVDHGTADTTFELTPNVLHKWGEVATLNLTTGTPTDGVVNEYMAQFVSGTTATVLTLPETVKWIGENTVEAGKTYQLSIIDNLAVLGGA